MKKKRKNRKRVLLLPLILLILLVLFLGFQNCARISLTRQKLLSITPTPTPLITNFPEPSNTPTPDGGGEVCKPPAPSAPDACTAIASAPGLVGDKNGNGVIDTDTVNEIGMFNDPQAGAPSLCKSGLTSWTYNFYSSGREGWLAENCQPGYKCLPVICVPMGGYARDQADCCSGMWECSTGKCVD